MELMPHSGSAENLIAELRQLGITIWVDNSRLRYKAPQGGLTPELKQRLVDNKDEVLNLLSGSNGSWHDSRLSPVVARPRDQERQLSFAQQRLWFLDQLLPDQPTYNMAYAYRLRGALDVEALRQAIGGVIERHEVLRTEIVAVDGVAHPRVASNIVVELPVVDLSACVEGEREAEARRLATNEARRPFDLSTAPLLRALLLRMDLAEHWLVLCLHHVVNDDWSFDILWQELDTFYQARLLGMVPELPELRIQYADFAAWQHEQLSAGRLDGQLEYWRRQLDGPRPILELYSDRVRPAEKAYHGDVRTFDISGRVSEALQRLAQHCNATLYMVLAAALKTLLHRYTGQDDVVVGTAIAGRRQQEIEPLIGFFINNLVLRSDLSGDPSFRVLIGRVRDVALAAYANQDVPFERVIEALRLERDPSRTPLFDVLLVLHIPPLARRLGGLQVGQLPVATATAKFDLTLELTETSDGLSGFLEYDSDLFEATTIDRLVGHFLALLEAVADAPDTRLSELSLLPEAERHQLLVEWNGTNRDYPRQTLTHELFEAQATRTPARIALRSGATVVSYGELDRRATRIAHALRSRGVGRGKRVGLCVERGADMVAAVLGILKAGAAYVPLDPLFPPDRLRFMAEDARLAVLVSTSALAAPFGVPRDRQLLLDTDATIIASAPDTRLPVDAERAQREDPAYVIYTSGSTGTPKGVVVPHRAVVNFLVSMAREPGLGADDVLVAVTTLSFDIAVLELLLPLTVGATVVIAGREDAVDGHALGALLEQTRATVMQATPVTWRLLLEAGWKGGKDFKALVGGEALPKDLADQLIASGVELWNMYGPTETTVWSTCARIADTSHGITIGRPIANTTIDILDAHQHLCPIGVAGELCIGGEGVTLGYWKRPELTATHFILDPFRPASGARLYRTGDRARWRNDGTLEHLGRQDFQVKIRGYRIELGEIETGMAHHPAVREVVVIAREDVPGDKRLVAYLVTENPPADLVDQLRAQLRAGLPEYMVPSAFVTLETLPRTVNGKLDRKALPAPDLSRRSDGRSYSAPRAPAEKAIAQIWNAVLGVDRVGIDDNFFELGGHSLLLLQTHNRLRASLSPDLPVVALFQYPTIRTLARYLDGGAGERPLVPEATGRANKQREALLKQRRIKEQR
jgi:amino acid adenylation domain-containing protein